MPTKSATFGLILVTAMCLSTTASFATFLVCPTVQEAKNLLQGTLSLLRAARDNKGDVSKAEIPFANCHADRTMTNPGELISKEHYVIQTMKNGEPLGIANASKYLNNSRNTKILLQPSGTRQRNILIYGAWLYKKIVNGKEHGIISVK